MNGLTKYDILAPSKPDSGNEINRYEILVNISGYYTAADAKNKKNRKSKVKPGNYLVYNRSNGMINVTTKKGVPGSWINPSDNKKESVSHPVYHTVVKGDTVSELAIKYGTTQEDIKKWNNLNSKYLIIVGQKLRVK